MTPTHFPHPVLFSPWISCPGDHIADVSVCNCHDTDYCLPDATRGSPESRGSRTRSTRRRHSSRAAIAPGCSTASKVPRPLADPQPEPVAGMWNTTVSLFCPTGLDYGILLLRCTMTFVLQPFSGSEASGLMDGIFEALEVGYIYRCQRRLSWSFDADNIATWWYRWNLKSTGIMLNTYHYYDVSYWSFERERIQTS